MTYTLEKADGRLFAVYQTLYSKTDKDMWYDWDRRLNDTLGKDGYFIMDGDEKIGGAVIVDKTISYAFLIAPFIDRTAFWKYLIREVNPENIRGVTDEDKRTLLMLGYKTIMTGQVMCRPTDCFSEDLPDGFHIRAIDLKRDAKAVSEVIVESYDGGICNEIFGPSTETEAEDDMKRVLEIYKNTDYSHVVVRESDEKIVGVCLAGIGENYTLNYAEIADLCVLPEAQGLGLAKSMVRHVLTRATETSPFVKLFVHVGNHAEFLYRSLGFIGGPEFSHMEKRTT